MTPPVRKPPRTSKLASLPDQVYERLRLGIINGDLAPGEKLVELDIAAQMGTSQGPVREALQRLEHDRLVERRARSATFVSGINADEMYELFSIRSVIEGFAVRRAALKITPEQCDELDELVMTMTGAGSRHELITLAEHDMLFHRRLLEWSGSTGLLSAWNPLANQLERYIVYSHTRLYSDFVEIGKRHQPIVEALRLHDADAAERAVRSHIMLIWSNEGNPVDG